jgi:hypothetical protein
MKATHEQVDALRGAMKDFDAALEAADNAQMDVVAKAAAFEQVQKDAVAKIVAAAAADPATVEATVNAAVSAFRTHDAEAAQLQTASDKASGALDGEYTKFELAIEPLAADLGPHKPADPTVTASAEATASRIPTNVT